MTPNEECTSRLLKAAKELMDEVTVACLGRDKWDTGINPKACYALFVQLEAAAKACEAAEVPANSNIYPIISYAAVCCSDCSPATEYPTVELYMSHVRECHIKHGPTLTDQQRKLGLRSLRHMGTDWENYDYD